MFYRASKIIGTAFLLSLTWQPFVANAASSNLDLVVKTAPIVPHGLIAGQPFDVTISFVDLDPAVPGIAMKKGGWAKISLPKEVVNTGFPVATPGKDTKGCEPPVLARCSSGGFLNGWPQSPLLPLNTIEYDEASHSLLLTATADAPAYSVDAPGVKLIHLFTFGFKNPDESGDYPMTLEIMPDPATDEILSGSAMLSVTDQRQANIAIDTTQSIHVKGPQYQNTMYQMLTPGSMSRNMSSNMWDAEHKPIVGASIHMTGENSGDLLAADGSVIGKLDIQAPAEAKGYYMLTAPSFATKTGLAGYPTGRLVTALKTASNVMGNYIVTLSLDDGNETVHTLRVK